MTKAEQAAAMKAKGKSTQQIANYFGWSIATASHMASRGKRMDEFRIKQRKHNNRYYERVRKMAVHA